MKAAFNVAGIAFIVGGTAALIVDLTGVSKAAADGVGGGLSWVGGALEAAL